MRAGILNEQIEIWEPEYKDTGYGHKQMELVWFYTTRANIRYDSGSRINDNNEIFYTNNVTFTIRYYVPVKPQMQIKYKDNFYRIISIKPSHEINQKEIITELVNE